MKIEEKNENVKKDRKSFITSSRMHFLSNNGMHVYMVDYRFNFE